MQKMNYKIIQLNQKGVAALEFAIVAPLLSLIAFGIIEFGMLIHNKQVIINASREGARAGIVRDSTYFLSESALKQLVKDYCTQRLIDFGGTTLTDSDIVLNPPTDSARMAAAIGSDFTVNMSYNYKFLAPSLLGMGSTTTISNLALMKMEAIP